MKKTLTALAIAGSLTFLGAGAAQARDAAYPQPPVSATVTEGRVGIGATILFQGTGFAPGSRIGILVSNEARNGASASFGPGGASAAVSGPIIFAEVQEDSTTADAEGAFSVPVTFNETGTYTLTASGVDVNGDPVTVEATVVVEGDVDGAAGGIGGGADNAANDDAVANGDRLADTGLDSSALLWGGAGLLALGAGATAVVVSRRKNA
ncbi:LPXTG cell wall anchor domain-containing protein [Crystallibacter degradans]|uniref:LPXTG cell wall anchor domain-containing protein n=1 Tax=Crystallibacter degradans TaxID=2726743 RepID=UPI0014740D68|nr:LPXTG cell wall anchor domain-containing protein [Arthrobacter sp. SF27]NMR28140.1 LPXTG cell wall anchor domain-containing protein [Arthrobacter sp. SF27]